MVLERRCRWALLCHVCERVVRTSFYEFTEREGDWPRCCGEPMAVFFDGHSLSGPPSEDSPDEHPSA